MRINCLIISSLVLLFLNVVLFAACEPSLRIEVENNTSETLTISVVSVPPLSGYEQKVGEVAPGAVIQKDLKLPAPAVDSLKVKAKNENDVLIYSKIFTVYEFLKVKGHIAISLTK